MIVNPVVKMRPHPAAHHLGATYTQSRCKTQSSCDLKRKFLSCLAPNTCFCFHFRLSMSAMWLASWATLVFCLQHIIFAKGDTLGCESMSETWPSRRFSLNGIPRSLYTHVIYAWPWWNKLIMNNCEVLLFSSASYGIWRSWRRASSRSPLD